MSQEEILEILTDMANALETLAVNTKHRIAELTLGKQENLDFSKLPWESKQGERGPFEQTSEKSTQNSDLWKQLKVKVKEHSGFWQHDGFRYWFDMKNENVIDRRKMA